MVGLVLWAIVYLPLVVLGAILRNGPWPAAYLIGPLINAINLPVLPIGLTILYLDLKTRKQEAPAHVAEGFAPA